MNESGTGEVLVYVTASNRAEALSLARGLLEGRLIACANVLDGATSLYWWGGKIEEAAETVLIAKTTAERTGAVTDFVKARHSYACPCVVALPITGGNPDFLGWIRGETAGAPFPDA